MRNITKVIIVVIVVLIIASASAGYVLLNKPAAQVKTLVVAAESGPDSLDPAITSSTPGWGVVQQIYQTLVAYDNSSVTSFVGMLASSWTVGPNGLNYTFTLRQNVTFSNGNPFNAYVMWYSINRAMLLNGSEAFVLEQNLNTSVSPSFLNDTTNFINPNASALAVMESNVNSVYVVSKYVLRIAVGGGYNGPYYYPYFLQTLTAPVAAAVDPSFVNSNGGVIPNQPNSYLSDNALGTGPYLLGQWIKGDHLTLTKSPSYWANNLSASKLNNAIAPAKMNVDLEFPGTVSSAIADMKSGSAQMMGFSFSPTISSALSGISNVAVNKTPIIYGATQGAWYLFFNLTAPYFNNTDVRAAVVHALNYSAIINDAFGGNAAQWVGPVPPGFPDYNPSNITPYSYNLALAKQEMSSAGYPNGLPGSFPFLYINSPDFASAVVIIKSDLQQIGINISLQGVTQTQWYAITSYPGGSSSYSIGIDFYTADYVAPDDYTWEIAAPGGSPSQLTTFGGQGIDPTSGNISINSTYFGNTSGPLNQLYYLISDATSNTSASGRTADYTAMTQIAYNNYLFDWLVVPYVFSIYNKGLHGMVFNPMGSAYPNFVMFYNTEYYT